jgi:hypothetical protein
VVQGAGIRHDAAGRNGAGPERPDELFEILFALRLDLYIGQRARDAPIGIIYRFVDLAAVFGGQSILRVPDVQRCRLKFNIGNRLCVQIDGRLHWSCFSPVLL